MPAQLLFGKVTEAQGGPATVLLTVVTHCPGFDQGILSVVYVMPRFLDQFPEVNDSVSTAASFNKG